MRHLCTLLVSIVSTCAAVLLLPSSAIAANSIGFSTASNQVTPGTTETVTITYSAEVSSPTVPIQVRLLDPSGGIVIEETKNLASGSGAQNFNMPIPGNLPNDNYRWHTQMFTADWGEILAEATQPGVIVVSDPATPAGTNELSWNNRPTSISQGESYPVKLNYSLTAAGIVHVQVMDKDWTKIGEEWTSLSPGSGVASLTFEVTGTPSATDNILQASLLDEGWQPISGVDRLEERIPGDGSGPGGEITFADKPCSAYPEGAECYPNHEQFRNLRPEIGYSSNWYVNNWDGDIIAYFGEGDELENNFWVEWRLDSRLDPAGHSEFDIRVNKTDWTNGADNYGFTTKLKDIDSSLPCTFEGRWTEGSTGRCHINMTAWIVQDGFWNSGDDARCDIIIHTWDNSGNFQSKYSQSDPNARFRNLGTIESNGVVYDVLRTEPGGAGEVASYNVIPQRFARDPILGSFPTDVIAGEVLVKDVIDRIHSLEVSLDGPVFSNEWYVHGMEWTVTGQSGDVIDGISIPDSKGRWTFSKYTIANLNDPANTRQAAPVDVKKPPVGEDGLANFTLFPNPTNTSFRLRYGTAEAEPVTITLLGADGRHIRTIQEGVVQRAGSHTETIDASNLAPGIYFVRISSPAGYEIRKLLKQ